MSVLKSIVMAFSMFSAIPMPHMELCEKDMRYMLAAFPLVGAVIGLFQWGAFELCTYLELGSIITAAVMTLLPALLTGGIHIDGLADTCDGLASHAPAEKKRQILHDPNCGAFAVIGVCLYLILYFALLTGLEPRSVPLYLMAFPLCRCLSGICSLACPSGGEGLLSAFRGAAHKRICIAVLLVLLAVCAAICVLISPVMGGVCVCAAVIAALLCCVMARRQFGGMSGDTAGFLLQICEGAVLFSLIITQRMLVI